MLRDYENWKHCITMLCGIALTVPYIEQRLHALQNRTDHTTQRFVATWGEAHRMRVIGWFEQARQDVG